MNVFKKAMIGTGFGALVAVMASGAAVAAPLFTVDPTSINGSGSVFTASDLNFTSSATVKQSDATTQTEVGYARLNSFGLNGSPVVATTSALAPDVIYGAVPSYYGLYFTFTATVSGVSGFGPGDTGTVTAFDFTLYADQGQNDTFTPGTCSTTCSNASVSSPDGDIALASGQLINGSAGFQPATGAPTLAAMTTFDLTARGLNYFIGPVPFYQFALTSTTANSGNVIVAASDGQSITINGINGGANFVPEPLTLSLFGAGLLGAGALRRRKAKKA